MRTCESAIRLVLRAGAGLGLVLIAAVPARASDAVPLPPADLTIPRNLAGAAPLSLLPPAETARLPSAVGPLVSESLPRARAAAPRPSEPSMDAFRSGVRGYNAGDKVAAARALEFAAGQGHALARWKLARMYASGDGVPHDDLKAFEHFSRIADEHAEDGPDSPSARVVASAFVALGSYFLDGIPGTYVTPDAGRARDMFRYAASYFGDPDGQYNLARAMLDGVGGPRDDRQAARWLNLAAEKGHRPSQALLGHLLFKGGQGVARRPAQGLMWLEAAREASDPVRDGWIMDLREGAYASASDAEKQAAASLVERRRK